MYATDIAKMIEVPILHVNGEDPIAVKFVTEMRLILDRSLDATSSSTCIAIANTATRKSMSRRSPSPISTRKSISDHLSRNFTSANYLSRGV